MSKIKHVSRQEMQRLLDERCPTMSPQSRAAILNGVPFEDADGVTYKAPDAPDDGKPTHSTTGVIVLEDPTWN